MGLAASQARMLLITARKSDVEFRGQTINNRRLALTYKLEEIARKYSDGISNRKIEFYTGNTDLYLDGWETIADANNGGVLTDAQNNAIYAIVDQSGNLVTNQDSDYVEAGLRDGVFKIVNQSGADVDWRSSTMFRDNLDESDDEVVTARYEYESALVQSEDKRLEVELKSLDTQQKALTTEMESVKKVIEKNIESSFKTFG